MGAFSKWFLLALIVTCLGCTASQNKKERDEDTQSVGGSGVGTSGTPGDEDVHDDALSDQALALLIESMIFDALKNQGFSDNDAQTIAAAAKETFLSSSTEQREVAIAAALDGSLTSIMDLPSKELQALAIGEVSKAIYEVYLSEYPDANMQQSLAFNSLMIDKLIVGMTQLGGESLASLGDMISSFSGSSAIVLRERYPQNSAVILNDLARNVTSAIDAKAPQDDPLRLDALNALLNTLGEQANVSGLSELTELIIDHADTISTKASLVTQLIELVMDIILLKNDAASKAELEAATLTNATMGRSKLESFFSNGSITEQEKDDAQDQIDVKKSTTLANLGICPTGYIPVPAYSDDDINVPAFCVMKYEAKDDGDGNAVSQAAGIAWVEINRGTAIAKCRDIEVAGYEFDLITNAQWQSLARQIERYESAPGVYVNWQNNSISGSNSLNRGNSDSGSNLAADDDDENGCSGTTTPINCDNTWHLNKRTHTLPNGEVIWDLAGNVWEWVKDDSNWNYGSNAYWYNIGPDYGNDCDSGDGCDDPQGKPKAAFGPWGDYSGKSSSPYGGLGYGWISSIGGAVLRGGDFSSLDSTGVFAALLGLEPGYSNNFIGFRCAAVLAP